MQVIPANVSPPPEAQEVYQGVAAPRRKRVEEQPTVGEMPKVLCASAGISLISRGVPVHGASQMRSSCMCCKNSTAAHPYLYYGVRGAHTVLGAIAVAGGQANR